MRNIDKIVDYERLVELSDKRNATRIIESVKKSSHTKLLSNLDLLGLYNQAKNQYFRQMPGFNKALWNCLDKYMLDQKLIDVQHQLYHLPSIVSTLLPPIERAWLKYENDLESYVWTVGILRKAKTGKRLITPQLVTLGENNRKCYNSGKMEKTDVTIVQDYRRLGKP